MAKDPANDDYGEHEGEENAYYCKECHGYIVTVNRDDGVTPMFLACRVKGEPEEPGNDCTGYMHSLMYPKKPWPEERGLPTEPNWEWYRPAPDEVFVDAYAEETRAHVEQGGLLLRKIEVTDG